MSEYPLTYAQFKEGLARGEVLGLHCQSCDGWVVPPQPVCPSCGGRDLTPGPVEPKGTIRTLTVIRVAPIGFEPPYVAAMVELTSGPWVMGVLKGVDPEEAGIDLIGQSVNVAGEVVPADRDASSRERAVLTFHLAGN